MPRIFSSRAKKYLTPSRAAVRRVSRSDQQAIHAPTSSRRTDDECSRILFLQPDTRSLASSHHAASENVVLSTDMTTNSLARMSDNELLKLTAKVAGDERQINAELLVLLTEIDRRELYLGEGFSSLFTYCTEVLRFSEHAAYHRIETVRAARHFPVILGLIADGSITTTTVAVLRPHLTFENHERLLAAARHKSKREVQHQVACLAPKADVRSLVRRLPGTQGPSVITSPGATPGLLAEVTPGSSAGETPVVGWKPQLPATAVAPLTATPRPTIEPLASDRYLLRLTLSADAHHNLRRAQDLMRHTVPNGDPAQVISRALALLVTQLERQKSAVTNRARRSAINAKTKDLAGRIEPTNSDTSNEPRGPASRALARRGASSRYLPAAVRRAVWMRDGGRCAFVGPRGRCRETGQLEFHHIVPFAHGGPPTPENIALRCRAHNVYESEQYFGLT